jgi:DnaJ-class molecular chaperone
LHSYEVLKDDAKRKAFDNGGFSGMGDGFGSGGGGGGGFSSGGFYGSGFESMGGNEAFANFWNQAFGGKDFSGFGSNRQSLVEVQVRASMLFLMRVVFLKSHSEGPSLLLGGCQRLQAQGVCEY